MNVPIQECPTLPLLKAQLVGCLESLGAAGFSKATLKKRRATFNALVRWLEKSDISDLDALSEQSIHAFLGRVPERRQEQRGIEAAGIRRLRAYLEVENGSITSGSFEGHLAADRLAQEYAGYLAQERGLSEKSIKEYLLALRRFLGEFIERDSDFFPERLNAVAVEGALLNLIPSLSVSRSRLLVVTLRSFFRFLLYRGHAEVDLSVAVPSFRASRHRIPAFLSPEQVESILSTPNQATPTGRRDFAVLLLLARLGLRAFEVVSLELDDLRWREGKLIIRGKGRVFESLPLLSEIGEAMAAYLQDGRPKTKSRRVFIRTYAPRAGLTGPAAIGHIVRRALSRAGVKPTGRGAAHLFRHSLATQMIRNGATIAEISQVLRHRSEGTTEIYAQVAFESLRGVAGAWPVPPMGAGR
jgi:site-specific recombinase XerD